MHIIIIEIVKKETATTTILRLSFANDLKYWKIILLLYSNDVNNLGKSHCVFHLVIYLYKEQLWPSFGEFLNSPFVEKLALIGPI